jgi:hypothetical protein
LILKSGAELLGFEVSAVSIRGLDFGIVSVVLRLTAFADWSLRVE